MDDWKENLADVWCCLVCIAKFLGQWRSCLASLLKILAALDQCFHESFFLSSISMRD